MKNASMNDAETQPEPSLPVYGQDAEGKKKRGFDCVLINGQPYIESINRDGHKVKTPASAVSAAFRQLRLKEKTAVYRRAKDPSLESEKAANC